MTKIRISFTAFAVSLITSSVVSIIVSLAMISLAQADEFQHEAFYSKKYCAEEFHGQPAKLPSGLKPDCVTQFAVIEFDWAKSPKHYQCIGQALVYASETGKLPVCVLLARDRQELTFAYAQLKAMHHAGVALRVIDLFGDH